MNTPKQKYKPIDEPIPPKIPNDVMRLMVDQCSLKTQVDTDLVINFLTNHCKKYRLGEAGALELLGRLIQLGLIGPGPVHQEWLKKRVRVI